MTIESQLDALYTQTQVLDATVTAGLIDVVADVSAVRSRVALLEIGQGPTIDTGTGGTGGTGGTTTSAAAVEIVTSLPEVNNYEGRTVLFENKLFVYSGIVWIEVESAATTVDAPPGVVVVGSLPSTGVEGDVIFNNADGYIYRRNNGIWVQVVVQVNTSTTVADASLTVAKFASGLRPVEIFGVLPTTGNVEGRLVYLTTDNKLYRHDGTSFINSFNTADLTGTISTDQIAANAITTGKIQAGAITASQIATDAVNAGKIAAGSITSDKIVANAITVTKIATGAITADKIEANAITTGKISAGAIGTAQLAANAVTADNIAASAITAAKIAAGAITSTKISVTDLASISSSLGAITGGTLKLGSAGAITSAAPTPPPGYTAPAAPGASGVGSRLYVDGSGYTFIDTLVTFGNTFGTSATYRAGIGSPIVYTYNTSTSTSGMGVKSYSNAGFAFYSEKGGVGPFTGAHDGLVLKGSSMSPGDIVVDSSILAKAGVSDAVSEIALSTTSNTPAIGVYVNHSPLESVPAAMRDLSEAQFDVFKGTHDHAVVNSVGEGQINVCGEGGNIQAGDLIVTSTVPGKGKKQSDDFVRSYTVARARESAVFTSGEIKQIACIYLAG